MGSCALHRALPSLPLCTHTRTGEVLKQVAPAVDVGVAPVVHEVRRHDNLLAHHVSKGQHGAVGVAAGRGGGGGRGGQAGKNMFLVGVWQQIWTSDASRCQLRLAEGCTCKQVAAAEPALQRATHRYCSAGKAPASP